MFFKNTIFRTNVIAKLTEVHDISRIVQRFALGRGTALDLVYLARSIEVVGSLQSILKMEAVKSKANAKVLEEYLENYDSLENLSKTILDNLDEVALLQTIRSEQEELRKRLLHLRSRNWMKNWSIVIVFYGQSVRMLRKVYQNCMKCTTHF